MRRLWKGNAPVDPARAEVLRQRLQAEGVPEAGESREGREEGPRAS